MEILNKYRTALNSIYIFKFYKFKFALQDKFAATYKFDIGNVFRCLPVTNDSHAGHLRR